MYAMNWVSMMFGKSGYLASDGYSGSTNDFLTRESVISTPSL